MAYGDDGCGASLCCKVLQGGGMRGNMTIRTMTIADYDEVYALWKSIRGLYILRWHLNFRCLKRFPLRITISCRR